MIQVDFQSDGFKELEAILGSLPEKIENRVLQGATRKALGSIKGDIVAAAPKSTGGVSRSNLEGLSERSINSRTYGQLHRNIKLENKRRKRKGSRGAAITTGDAFWGNFLEKGTRYIAATFWFSAAVRLGAGKVFAELQRELARGIDRELKKR